MAYAGTNNFSKKVSAPSQPSGTTSKQYASTAGSLGARSEPTGSGGLGGGSSPKSNGPRNAKKV